MLTARQTPPSQRVVGRWLVLVDLCEARLLEASCFQSQWSEPREKKKKLLAGRVTEQRESEPVDGQTVDA